MKIYIGDTNIIIDLIKLEIISEFFSLEADFYTTHFITSSIDVESYESYFSAYIQSKRLTVYQLTGEEIKEISIWKTTPYIRRMSERSVLWTVCKTGGIVLNADPKIQNELQLEATEAHGTGWVIDRLVDANIICTTRSNQLHQQLKKLYSAVKY